MNEGCSSLFVCSDVETDAGINIGSTIFCPSDSLIHVDFNWPLGYSCEEPASGYTCPGSYHFGCDGGDFGNLTTTTAVATTSTTQGTSAATTTTTEATTTTTESTTTTTCLLYTSPSPRD